MLQAILHSKVGSQFTNLTEETHWREVYRAHEDFLTAAVFGRLIYLDPKLLWKILKTAAVSGYGLPEDAGPLNNVKFWPTLALPDDYISPLSITTRQPDLVLEFAEIDLIVESKLENTGQYPEQLAEEYIARQSLMKDRDCYMIAVGGLKYDEPADIESLETRANQFIESNFGHSELPPLRLAGFSWNHLNNVIAEIQRSERLINTYLYEDLRKIFKLHGIRSFQETRNILRRIFSANLLKLRDDSLELFGRLHNKTIEEIVPLETQANWLTKTKSFRSIAFPPNNTIRRIKSNE